MTSLALLALAALTSCCGAQPALLKQFSADFTGYKGDDTVVGKIMLDISQTPSRLYFKVHQTLPHIWPDFPDDTTLLVRDFRNLSAQSHTRAACIPSVELTRTAPIAIAFYTLTNDTYKLAPGDPDLCKYSPGTTTWTTEVPHMVNLTLCLNSDGVPEALGTSAYAEFVGASNVVQSAYALFLSNLTTGAPDFPAQVCKVERPSDFPPLCPPLTFDGVPTEAPAGGKDGPWINFKVYRLTNGEPWGDLYNRDTAALGGILSDFVDWYSANPTHKYIEVFNVSVLNAFATWRDCNYFPEEGGNKCGDPLYEYLAKYATRMGASGFISPWGGQCASNYPVGTWFTFPLEGECNGDPKADCTWKVVETKVVNETCVYEAGNVVGAQMQEFGRAPWPKTQAALLNGIRACADIRKGEDGLLV